MSLGHSSAGSIHEEKIAPQKPSNVKANNEHQDSGVGTSWRRQCFAGKVQIIRIIDLMTNE